jgi:hypothetical protein
MRRVRAANGHRGFNGFVSALNTNIAGHVRDGDLRVAAVHQLLVAVDAHASLCDAVEDFRSTTLVVSDDWAHSRTPANFHAFPSNGGTTAHT